MAEAPEQGFGGPPSSTGSPVRRWVMHAVKAGIGVGIVVYLLRKYDTGAVLESLGNAHLGHILLACLYGALSLYGFALMYRVATRPLGMPLTTLSIMKIQLQIRFYALFMPGAANAVVKWYKFAKPAKQPAQALLVMGFTRVLHTVSMLGLALVGVMGDRLFPWAELRYYLLAGLVVALAVFFMLTSKRFAAPLQALVARPWPGGALTAPVRKRAVKLAGISTGFQTFTGAQLAALLAASMAGSFFQALQMLALAHAVGLPIGILTMCWLRGVSQFVATIPVSISGLGLREASMVAILVGYGITEPGAISFSLLIFAVAVIGKGLVGGVLEGWEQFRGPAPREAA